MRYSDLQGTAVFLGAGFFLIAFGVAAKRGYARTRYSFMHTINPLVAPVDAVYGAIPVGLGSVLVGIGILADNGPLIVTSLAGGTIFGFVFVAWKPNCLKPEWLLRLEEYYDHSTIKYMFNQVKCDRSHSKKVRSCTQEELYVWAEEMARKYEQLVTDPHTIWEQHL